MRCSKCNTEFDSEYCPNCGKKAKNHQKIMMI